MIAAFERARKASHFDHPLPDLLREACGITASSIVGEIASDERLDALVRQCRCILEVDHRDVGVGSGDVPDDARHVSAGIDIDGHERRPPG